MAERPTSEFSRVFSRHLRGFMRDHDIDQAAVARLLGRSTGFISERTSGKRPPDTDIIDAVAHLAHVTPVRLSAELARRMAESSTPERVAAREKIRAEMDAIMGPLPQDGQPPPERVEDAQ